MNTRQKPWSDVHVRRAVAYALDRTALITADGGPTSGTPLYTLIPPQALSILGSRSEVNGVLKSVLEYPFSIAKAKRELAASAYPKGFSASTNTADIGPTFIDVNQVIAANLAKIGIRLSVHVISSDAWITEIFGPKTFGDVYSTWGTAPDSSSRPASLLGSNNVKPGRANLANYVPKSVDELLARGLAATKPSARLAIYGQLLRKLGTDVPYVPLFEQSFFPAVSDKFTIPHPGDFAFLYFWDNWGRLIKAESLESRNESERA
jgi:peptide/nickel transport system substrate-binding protein